MQGFDAEFTDLPDYILKITERIWEGRQVGAIRRYYDEHCIVRTPMALLSGAEAMVSGTLATLHLFPDRRLLGEDVIWSGDEARGFYSSHRIFSPMHHRGDGAFGPATGRFVKVRAIADCAVKDNRVYEEWLVRDQAAIVRQTGQDPRTFAAAQVASEIARGGTPGVFLPEHDAPGRYQPTEAHLDEALAYAGMLQEVVEHKALGRLREHYEEAVAVEVPGGECVHGKAALDAFWLGYLAAFPDVRFTLEHLIGRNDPGRGVRVAARWSLRGRHAGHGAFGTPSGADVYVMGISHAEFANGRVLREWVLVDELAIWRQIALARG